ncbi:MAG: tRNA (adenosine(37)-N6)-threonylcarbamoyltransferase complex ATPase subunit type 1 TsaE [Candidatus Zambryskibacteria bacterium]
MEFLSKSVAETAEIATGFANNLKSNEKVATIVGLYGELGSGKTTFMKYLAENFGIKETIKSPTFVIEKIYDLTPNLSFDKLIHIDAYRIEKEEEMLNLGWNEIIADPKNLICIEWPERIAKILPKHIVIKFEHVSETERKISINSL